MAISVNEARQVTLHCREGATATPLHPVTSADVVAYRNGSAGFAGETTRAALDELFRRLGVVEGEILPPVIAVPGLLAPEAETLVAEGEELTLTSTPFAMSSGKDTHTASEWRITGADGRQLWSSGESADRLESFPGLAVNRETLPGVVVVPDGAELKAEALECLGAFSDNYFRGIEGDGVLLCWEARSATNMALRQVVRSEDGGRIWGRVAHDEWTKFSDIVWTGTRFLSFWQSSYSPSQVMVSTDHGDTWTQAGTLPLKNTGAVRGAALNGVLVATASSTTLYRSEDDGATWTTVTCPITAKSIFTAHGHFVVADSSSWAASADGQNWFQIAALEGMKVVEEDAVGLVGVSVNNTGSVSFVRVSGEYFQTTDRPEASYKLPFTTVAYPDTCLLYDAASGMYVLAVQNNNTNDPEMSVLWCGMAYPEATGSGVLLSDVPGWTSLSLARSIKGTDNFYSCDRLLFAGQKFIFCNIQGDVEAGWEYPQTTLKCALSVGMVGKLLSEQLLASVRHKGERAGWSDWAADVPFTAELGTGSAAGTEGLEQQSGETFDTRWKTSYGTLLETEFTVPEGVTELLVLCASGVSSQPGRAASCRVSVTPGQVIPVSVGGFNSTTKKVVTTSSFGSFISCDPSGVTCPSGTLMEFQGAAGYSSTYRGGGFAFVTDDEWRNFALHGADQQPIAATSTGAGLNVGWNGFSNMVAFCGGHSTYYGQSGIIKVWWGPQIEG